MQATIRSLGGKQQAQATRFRGSERFLADLAPSGLCSLDIWRGALWMIYAPKVATGLSPGFQPWGPSK
jgi:hypothetical protein